MNNEQETFAPSEILRRYKSGERDFRGLEIDDASDLASFRAAKLDGADFSRSAIVADFTQSSLRGCRFVGANIKTCAFDAADLSRCDFSGAAIDSATFGSALMEGASFAGATAYGNVLGETDRPG